MSGNLIKYFEKINMTNKISHSFIIGNTSLSVVKEELEEIISNYIFNEKVDIFNDSDVIIIEPVDSKFITKDQILDMRVLMQNTSLNHSKKVYIINNAEHMNDYASNSLLKFLEEPEENIYAFLITNNINNIITTIKSRCQLIFLSSEIKEKEVELYEEEELNLETKFIRILENYKEKAIARYTEIQIVEDKNKLTNIFNIILLFYRECINYKMNNKIDIFINNEELVKKVSESNRIEELSKKMLIINDIITKLNYNLNVNLLLDRFIIEFGGVKND